MLMLAAAPVVVLLQSDADSRAMYAEFLRYQGFVPVPMSTAADALSVAPRADVVVTGILLPGQMDGIELVTRLKTDDRTKRIPVIVLTACAWQSDRDRATTAGCDVFLPKPCLPDALVREVRRLLAASTLRDVRGAPAKVPKSPANPHERAADYRRLK